MDKENKVPIGLKSKKAKKILKILEGRELTTAQIAKRIKACRSYAYLLLYRLEAMGKVERKRWEGAWIWGLKK